MFIRNRRLTVISAAVLAGAVACLVACKQNDSSPATAKTSSQPAPVLPPGHPAMPEMGSAPNQAAGIAWTVPSGWEVGSPRQMSVATYRIHAIAGDPEDAECAVYFFGSGQGGSVDANLQRWAEQFVAADGQSPAQTSKTETRTIAGFKVSTISAAGTYLGSGVMMGQQPASKPNFRMRGAIVEAPEGLVFFKLTGPSNTVAAADGDFNSLLGSLHRQYPAT